ncbi:MAG TPA: 6-hydroxycyclohex-1-ene-1-carbonyl-CoA dehydrogenase [Terriglobales bacterium]|nr:6-hydroxycyclohex-1-ene-1-carbonyl-CoA dehydrogenase [Terriglobales bacterium]
MQPAYGYELTAVGAALARCELALAPAPDEVVIEVAGCGVCHTDVGFAYDGVPTRHALPLVLGHEISGRVVETGELAARWMGKSVIVPAVIPCGKCPACLAGRPTICAKQFMPGNDGHGGFATHVRVSARGLCEVPEQLPSGVTAEMLSVVADAVTTPYEAIRRSGLSADDVAVFVGVGGVGGFGVQIAAARGAAVVAVDVEPDRLALAAQHGASLAVNARELDEKELKKRVRAFAKESGKRGIGTKVFETSGTPAGQQTAFSLLDFGGYLAVVGFTPKKAELRLSNLMALDATARGNWGCPPEQYPAALQLVLDGKVALAPYVESHPLDEAPQVLEAVAHHALTRRVILKPSRNGGKP